jgi:hypothetical protein
MNERGQVAASAAPGRRGWAGPDSSRARAAKRHDGHATDAVAENGSNGNGHVEASANGTAEDNTGSNGSARRERSARIVSIARGDTDAKERERQRLMDRLMASETRGAISRSADEYTRAGFDFPEEQAVQLQLLEHFDEERARGAIEVLARLIERETPLKKPILEQRLRRLEEYGDEPATRSAAADLRRAIRA